MLRPYALLVSIVLFATASIAFAGGDRWWELYTPEEQKKLFAEHARYLMPDKDGRLQVNDKFENFTKAYKMLTRVPGQEEHVTKAAIAWADLSKKAIDNKIKLSYDGLRMSLLIEIWRTTKTEGRGPWKMVDKQPDRMIDEYFWALKYDGDKDRWLYMIGSFGPRASDRYGELRDYLVEKTLVQEGKAALDRIKKK